MGDRNIARHQDSAESDGCNDSRSVGSP